jgi:hypothetical protein
LGYVYVFAAFKLLSFMMSKSKAKLRKYSSKWEKEKWAKGTITFVMYFTNLLLDRIKLCIGWLTQEASPDSFHEAYCRVCKTSLRAHASDLKAHAKKLKHQNNASRFIRPKNQKQIDKIIEIKNEDKG